MTFQDLGGIGEFIGGIGVIVTMLYLAFQIRQNSRIERLNARYAVSQSMANVMEKLDGDPELERIWLSVMETGQEPADAERERLGRFLYRLFGELSNAESFAELDPRIASRYEPILTRFLRVPAVQSWWSRQRIYMSEPFRSRVDSSLLAIQQDQESHPEATGRE